MVSKIFIILFLFLSGSSIILVSFSIFNKESKETEVVEIDDEKLLGVSRDSPDIISDEPDIISESGGLGGSIPAKVWTQGAYYFSGSSGYGNLFTNYEFPKGNNYNVCIENTGSSSLNIIVMKDIMHSVKEPITIPGNSKKNFSISETETLEDVYLAFYGSNSNFSFEGYIEKNE